MEVYFLWGSIGLLALFLLIGLLSGLIRGLKRSSLHFIFLIISILIAFFVTKTVTNAVLGITITADGTVYTLKEFIVHIVQTNFDITSFETATEFLAQLPNAIVSPILFIFLTLGSFIVIDIIYLIVARICFGSKKKDFANHKAHRWFGGLVGAVEGFVFLFILFAPLTSLTKTYAEIVEVSSSDVSTQAENSNKLQTIGETLSDKIPSTVNEIIYCYNNSVIGKISGAGGLDDALFDYLSNFDLNGEKIEFRQELVSITSIYDEFVVVYNNAIDKNYTNIDLTTLKQNLEEFLNKGLFKTVVADTINDIVVKFDTIKDKLNLDSLPQTFLDVINDIQSVFAAENFNTYEYLKHDILKVVDIADTIFKNEIITKFEGVDSFVKALEVIDQNNTAVSAVAKDVLKLNLVKDSFNTIGKIASEKIEELIDNSQNLEIALNMNVENKEQLIEDLLDVVDNFIELNKLVDIPKLLDSTDIVASITEIEDLGTALTKAGETLDSIRELDILVLPVEEGKREEKVYVLDNILKNYDFDILVDEVYLTTDSTEKTKLDTYTKFFNFIKNPIVKAKELGFTSIENGVTDFDVILDKVLVELKVNEDIFADVLLPFYQLSAMDLKTLVFDEVFNQLSEYIMIDVEEVKTADSIKLWDAELKNLGNVINLLDQGEIEIENQTKTYLKYLLDVNYDLETLMKAMVNDNKLKEILNPILSAKFFKTLTKEVFDNIDNSIESLTNVKPTTFATLADLTVLEDESVKVKTIDCIQDLLNLTLNIDMNNLSLADVGTILDILKTNAFNDGNKNGVFNNIFANVVWYMTGDNLNSFDYTGKTPYEKEVGEKTYEDVKAYLNVETLDGYYTINYQAKFAELEVVIEFADSLNGELKGIVLSDSTLEAYIRGVEKSVDEMKQTTEEEKVKVLENMKTLIDSNGKDLLTSDEITTYGNTISSAINQKYGADSALSAALKNLFGV